MSIRGLMAYLVHVQCKEHQVNLAKQKEIDKLPPSLKVRVQSKVFYIRPNVERKSFPRLSIRGPCSFLSSGTSTSFSSGTFCVPEFMGPLRHPVQGLVCPTFQGASRPLIERPAAFLCSWAFHVAQFRGFRRSLTFCVHRSAVLYVPQIGVFSLLVERCITPR